MRRRKAQHIAQLVALFALVGVLACDRVTPVAPVGSTITISVNPSRIDAAGESATVTIIVRKEDGTPVNPGTQVNVSTTLGSLDPEVAFTDETGVANSVLTGDGRIGMATVSATTGAAALVSVDVQIGSVAASITLTATPTNVPKDPTGDEGVIQLLALIRDDTGAPLGGGFVNFRTDIGNLGSQGASVVTNDLGEARDTLTVGRNDISTLLDPFFLVGAETAIEGGSLILDELEIDIRGVPATLTLQVNPSTIPEAGGAVSLTALVRDNLGDPLAEVGVNFLTEAGSLSSQGRLIDTDQDGQAFDTLSATEAQLATQGTGTFDVTAQTTGLGGTLLEQTFQIRIESSRPNAAFETAPLGGKRFRFTFTGTVVDASQADFTWVFAEQQGNNFVTEATLGGAGVTTVEYEFIQNSVYRVTLTVSDNFGSDNATATIDLTPP